MCCASNVTTRSGEFHEFDPSSLFEWVLRSGARFGKGNKPYDFFSLTLPLSVSRRGDLEQWGYTHGTPLMDTTFTASSHINNILKALP